MANEVNQAAYLAAVYAAATEAAQRQMPPVDLLGRTIVSVTLTLEQKAQHEASLGHPIQDTVIVSLDLQDTSRVKHGICPNTMAAFNQIPKSSIISLGQETYFHAHLIGRMIKAAAIKAEAPINEANFKAGLDTALRELNERIIQLQAQAIKKAYAQSLKKGTLDVDLDKFKQLLNKELDNARKELLPHIAKTIKEQLTIADITLTTMITDHLTKELAEATSATADDYVHIDKSTGSISFIGASEHTSHHQELGAEHTADRIIYTHHLAENDTVTPLSDRQHVRVPSLALRKIHRLTQKLLETSTGVQEAEGLIRLKLSKFSKKYPEEEIAMVISEYQKISACLVWQTGHIKPTSKQIEAAIKQAIINDTAKKIRALQDRYGLAGGRRYETTSGKYEEGQQVNMPQAFIYNLYTTLNKNNLLGWIDERSNKQSQSAEYILAAAHQYNRNNPGKPLCLVLNMPVNGWGHELTIRDSNPDLVNEAALMAQMASIHTVFSALHSEMHAFRNVLFNNYNEFLKPENNHYSSFYRYLKDKNPKVLKELETAKSKTRVAQSQDTRSLVDRDEYKTTFKGNARNALAALFTAGAFSHHKNGFTYQALSVFVAGASIGGCKSANERTQAVNGRVAILDFVSLPKAERDKILGTYTNGHELRRLTDLADNLENAVLLANPGTSASGITKSLNALYESLNLEGFQAVVSFIDQGGHAKLGTKGGLPNTNNAEDVRVHVKNAAKWQCHKGLFKHVLEVFCGTKPFEPLKAIKKAVERALPEIALVNTIGLIFLGIVSIASIAFPPLGGAVLAIIVGTLIAMAVVSAVLVMEHMVYEFLDSKREKPLMQNEDEAPALEISLPNNLKNTDMNTLPPHHEPLFRASDSAAPVVADHTTKASDDVTVAPLEIGSGLSNSCYFSQ